MKKIVLVMVFGMCSMLMADMTVGTFGFDMKSTLKSNGKADEQMTYLLKNMSKDINKVIVNKDKSVTLSNGKERKEKFSYKKVAENKYKIDAGRGIELTPVSNKKLKLGMKMQNSKMLYLMYTLAK